MTVHVDANVLVALVTGDKNSLAPLQARLKKGTPAATSAMGWFEFLCGPPRSPLTIEELEIVKLLVGDRIVPIDAPAASLAARIFNQTGRTKGSQGDCLVAATAMVANAELFTLNVADFAGFERFGLRLIR